LGIKGAEGFGFLASKSALILDVFERVDKGLLILASRGEFLEFLGEISSSFEAVSKLAGDTRRSPRPDLQ